MGVYRHPPSPHIGRGQPLEPRKLPPSITAVPENNPPFGLKNPLWPILRMWQPFVPLPWPGWKLPPSISAVPADNPPFGRRGLPAHIIESWRRDFVALRTRTRFVHGVVLSIKDIIGRGIIAFKR
jgi:hypothetical protein